MPHEPGRADDALLTTKEVASILRVSPGTVKRWRFEGVGPTPVRVTGRVVRYQRSELERITTPS